MSPVIMCATLASRNIAGARAGGGDRRPRAARLLGAAAPPKNRPGGGGGAARARGAGPPAGPLVRGERRAATHLDVAAHALDVGGQQRVRGERRRLVEQA